MKSGIDPLHQQCLTVIDAATAGDRERIIKEVAARFEADGSLEPQFAVQKWIQLIAQENIKGAVRRHGRTDKAHRGLG